MVLSSPSLCLDRSGSTGKPEIMTCTTILRGRALRIILIIFYLSLGELGAAQSRSARELSGTVTTKKNEAVQGVGATAISSSGEVETVSDADGRFVFTAPDERLVIKVQGKYIIPQEREIPPGNAAQDLQFVVEFKIPPIHESLVITAQALDPEIDRRNDAVYKNTLFGRDDQLLFTLDAGINAGQHEGGGKSLEIRRFGFNLDHGG